MITLISGCMGAGKTARLIEIAEQVPKYNRLVLPQMKVDGNVFLSGAMVSRTGKSVKTTRCLWSEKMLLFVKQNVTHVFIDEGQWCGKQVIDNAKKLSDVRDIQIYVALLNRDYTGRKYDSFLAWERVADEVLYMRGVCAVTGGYATYSELLTDTESTNKDDYRAVCEEIFRKSKHCRI